MLLGWDSLSRRGSGCLLHQPFNLADLPAGPSSLSLSPLPSPSWGSQAQDPISLAAFLKTELNNCFHFKMCRSPPGLINVPEHKPLALPSAGVKEQPVCSCVLKGCAVSGHRNVIGMERHFSAQPHLGPTSAGPRGSWSCPCREHQESITFLETVVLCNAQTCVLLFPLL